MGLAIAPRRVDRPIMLNEAPLGHAPGGPEGVFTTVCRCLRCVSGPGRTRYGRFIRRCY